MDRLEWLAKVEEGAKVILSNISNGEFSETSLKWPLLVSYNYLEEMGYLEVTGGTAKSGAGYRITDEGKKFAGL